MGSEFNTQCVLNLRRLATRMLGRSTWRSASEEKSLAAQKDFAPTADD